MSVCVVHVCAYVCPHMPMLDACSRTCMRAPAPMHSPLCLTEWAEPWSPPCLAPPPALSWGSLQPLAWLPAWKAPYEVIPVTVQRCSKQNASLATFQFCDPEHVPQPLSAEDDYHLQLLETARCSPGAVLGSGGDNSKCDIVPTLTELTPGEAGVGNT